MTLKLLPIIGLLGVLLSAPAIAAEDQDLKLPDLGDSSARVLSREQEHEYSTRLLQQMRNYDVTVEDPELIEYLETLGYRLVLASGRTEQNFHFVLIDFPVVNAFASPGGVIATYAGLMLAAENENELAGVLAHEIAHVTQRHIARRMESTMEDAIPILLGTIAMAAAASGQGDGAQAAMVSGMALLQQRQINFTRDNEYEADRIGIQTLAKAGFNPVGMADFFARLNVLYRVSTDEVPEYLRTHPVTTTRIAEAKARAGRLERETQRSSSLEFQLMRERLRVLSHDDPHKLAEFYRGSSRAARLDPQALAYGVALAQMRTGQYAEARRGFAALAERDPERLSFALALAEVDRAERRFEAANQRYAAMAKARPGHRVVAMMQARCLLEEGKPEGATLAADILKPLLVRFPDDLGLFESLGRAHQLAGDEVAAGEAYARAFFLRGRLEDALRQLEQMALRADLDYYQRARIDAQIAEWRPVVLEERRRNLLGGDRISDQVQSMRMTAGASMLRRH